MVKQKSSFSEVEKFTIFYRKSPSDSGILVTLCDTFDAAVAYALNLHQLSNVVHFITVLDENGEELMHISRLEPVRLNLQSNGR